MKERFKEYIAPTEEEKRTIWENATIVFDTNILFNLYRYTAETRDDLLAVMEEHRDHLWMPYQVGFEYFNKRLEIIDKIACAHNVLKEKLNELKPKIEEAFNKDYSNHPLIKRDEFFAAYDEAIISVHTKLDEWMQQMPDYRADDTILTRLLSLYDGKTGEDSTPEQLAAIYKEGEARFKESVPPGYKDWKKKENEGKRHQSGDLIIWKQMMDYAKTNGTDIIFVTEDQKEDWWYILDGKIESPRAELLREFKKETDKTLLMYRQKGFLTDARADVKATTTEEVEVISEGDKEAFSRAVIDDVIEGMTSRRGITEVYPASEWTKLVSNPLQGIIESQKRLHENIIAPLSLTSSIADLVESQKNVTSVAAQAAKLAMGSPFTSQLNWAEQLWKK